MAVMVLVPWLWRRVMDPRVPMVERAARQKTLGPTTHPYKALYGKNQCPPRMPRLAFPCNLCQNRAMVKHLAPIILASLLATSLVAQTSMDAATFETYTRGKTLYFESDGSPFGTEQYLPNRRVRWAAQDGYCKTGRWYPDGQMICFLYEASSVPQCWAFYQTDSGLTAQYGDGQGAVSETRSSTKPISCLGPEIGVKFSPKALRD